MPEYLAPDVYVEEIDTGSKPIEGASTSTTGMIGVTERGPVSVPILITSTGEFRRWFGESLSADLYGEHRFLPHAVEGFFTNGGKRLYVVRVLSLPAAADASTRLFRHQSDSGGALLLVRSAANASAVLLIGTGAPFAPAATDWIRIGSGSDAEYLQATGPLAASAVSVMTRIPLQRSHPVAANSAEHYVAALPGPLISRTLTGDHPAGSAWLSISGVGAVVADRILQIVRPGPPETNEELIFIRSVVDLGGGNLRIELETPLLFDHVNGETVRIAAALPAAAPLTNITRVAVPGDATILVAANAGFATGDLIRLVDGTRGEIRRIGSPQQVGLGAPLTTAASAGLLVEHVTRADNGAIIRTLDEAVAAGTQAFAVDDRQGMVVGEVIRVGAVADPDVEYAAIAELPAPSGAMPDPGRIVLTSPLRRAHGGTTLASRQIVARQTITVAAEAATILHAAPASATEIFVTAPLLGGAPTTNDLLRIVDGDRVQYVRIDSHTARSVQQLSFTTPLSQPHAAPQPLVIREPLLDVFALDAGVWGNRLRVAARRETTPLVRSRIRNDATGIQDPTHIRMDSASGVEPGTILSLADATGTPFDTPFKVIQIDRQNGYLLTLDTALPAAAALGSAIVSIEFALGVYLLRQPDPAQPARNVQVIDFETFRHLSLDPRHSRYVHRVIGTTWTPPAQVDDDGRPLRLADRRSEGGAAYVRVRDRAQDFVEPQRTTTLQSIRLGPEFLVDILPDGRREPARRALAGGLDSVGALDDVVDYVGTDDPEPALRTGLQVLRNIEDISIVAAPGRVSAILQGGLIAHCELMRYRFAVLDGTPPPDDSLADIQTQRQQFDTKYAALYHPWLLIPDPYPTSTPTPDYAVPPSGHVLGVYARTDVERGVHKAPANEVVRGIVGLQRRLTKGEQEILNPYPTNINVIRDFREDSRGIRVYGGRVITTDSDWKYVNVRRLLIFIEASIDRGLQWVVFEPNAEPLWARVRRSITNFLTLVWRNGALEGTRVEEAFFVRCDRTTMTQTDIDSGRLICVVGVAPVKPAEFVIVRIGLWTAHADE